MMIVLSTVLNFSVVVYILVHFGRKPFKEFLQSRSERIRKSVEESSVLAKQAETELKTWEEKRALGKKEIESEWESRRAILARQKQELLESARAEGERLRRDARLVQESEMARARQAIQRQVAEESLALARKSLMALDEKQRAQVVTATLEGMTNGSSR